MSNVTPITQAKPTLSPIDQLIKEASDLKADGNYKPLINQVATQRFTDLINDVDVDRFANELAKNKALGIGKRAIKNTINDEIKRLRKDAREERQAGRMIGGYGEYECNDSGVLVYRYNQGGVNVEPDRVSSPLTVEAQSYSTANDNRGLLLTWKDTRGHKQQWSMPLTIATGDGKEAIKILESRGLCVVTGQEKHLIDYIKTAGSEVERTLICTTKTGWHNDTFVTPDTVYGEGSDDLVFQPETGQTVAHKSLGTLDEWREVARYCTGNSRLVLSVSIAFAGALLKDSGIDGGGFHLHGGSSDGKSTAQLIAASVWGKPEDYAKTWRTTDNAMEGIAEAHNDGLLVLDEMGQGNFHHIGETVYMLANGQGKARMDKDTSLRKVKTWQLLFLSSGEVTLQSLLQSNNRTGRAGQEVRLADIPSDAGAGMGLFEDVHDKLAPALFADFLKHESSQCYGVAGTAWLKYLTSETEWREEVANAVASFVKNLGDTSKQAGRVAQRFGLVAYAGELATKAGITGWSEGEATAAAKRCFNDWVKDFGTGNREERQILEAVCSFMEANPARFEVITPAGQVVETGRVANQRGNDEHGESRPVYNRVGFIRSDEPDCHYVLAGQLTELCKGAFSRKQVLDALLNAGWTEDKPAKQRWMNGSKHRCYKLKIQQ